MKNLFSSIILLLGFLTSINVYSQCNPSASICTPGLAGPFTFNQATPGPPTDFANPTGCSTGLFGNPNGFGFIILHITTSGNLNLLVDGNAGTGFIDVVVYNIPNGVPPCTAVMNSANEIGCNYATAAVGCTQFGNDFGCASSVAAPAVTAGQTLMVIVHDYSTQSNTYTLQLGPSGAQTGPPNPAIVPSGPYCSTNTSVQLTAVNAGGTWSGPGTSPSGNFNPSAAGPGVHTINYTIGTAPCSASSSTTITVNAPGPITVNPNPASMCVGGSVSLTANGAAGYIWSPSTGLSSTTGATVTANPASTTTYTVNSNAAGCNLPANVTVTVNPLPNANAGTNRVITCSSPTVVLGGSSSTTGSTFSWSGPGIVSGGNTLSPTVNAAGTYTLTVTSPAGCVSTSSMTVSTNLTPPNANAGPPQTINCGTTTATLNGSSSTAGATFSWSGPGIVSGGTTASPIVNAGGTYTLTVTNPANGCTATSTVTVTNSSVIPNANAGAPQTLTCATTSVTLNGSSSTAGATFSWSGPGIVSGGTSASPVVNAAGTYTLTVTNPANGCTNTSTVAVTLNNTPPNANAGTPRTLTCTTTSATLGGSSSTAGATFSWSGPGIVSGGTSASPVVNAAGTYTLTVTNPANGCTNTSTVAVSLNNTPPNANAGTPQTLTCTATSVTLNGSSSTAGATFSWSGPGIVSGGTSASPTVNAAGTYTLTVTNPANGCTNTSTVVVNNSSGIPNANAGTPQTLTCTTTSVTLNGSSSTAGATFSWSGPGIVSGGTSASPTVNAAGTYTLTVTNPANGCTNTATVAVSLNNTPPNANAGTPQTLTCTTTSVTLGGSSSTAGATFSWSGPGIVSGGTSTSPVVNAAGTYTLTVTNPANGCTNTSTVAVTLNNTPPNANAGTPQTITCAATSVNLGGSSSTAGATFSWSGPGIVSGGTSASPTVNAAGTYTLTVTNPANGCTNTSTVAVSLNNTPPNANAGTPQTLTCTATSVTLNGSSSTAGATFSWSGPGIVSGGTSASPTVNAAGTYTLTVTNPSNGCTNTSTVVVNNSSGIPNANAGAPQTLTCTTTSITLNGSSTTTGATFSWSGPGIVSGGTSATPVVNAPGTYILTVTNPSNGCTNTSTVAIPQNIAVPNANAGAPQTLTCTTTSVTLSGSSTTAGATFSWTGPGIVSGGTSATPVVNAPGTYTLTVTDPVNGCTNTSTVVIPQNIVTPNANAGTPQTITCTATSVTLNGSSTTAGATFSWSGPGIVSGGTSASPTVNAAGTYTLTVTNPGNGCTNTSTVVVNNSSGIPNANAGAPQTLTCTTTSITLNGSSTTAGATFSWAGPGIVSGGTSATPVVNAPGTYTLTVTNPSNGCTNTSTVAIPQNIAVSNANAGAPQTLTCTTTSVTLNGSSSTAGATFSWAGPGIVSGGTSATPVVNAPGTYTLTVTDPVNGCTNTSTVAIPQNIAVPNANAGAPQTLTCTTTSVTLSGSSSTAGATFSWAGPGIVSGGTSATPVVNAPGTYTVTVTDPVNGCTNTSTVAIPQNIVTPNANAGAPQTLTCTTTSVTLSGSSTTAGATFSWSGPGIVSGGTSATPTVNAAGTYTLTVTNPTNGCTNTSTVVVNNSSGIPNANAGAPQTLTCTTTSITLSGSSTTAGATFSWAGPGIVSGGTSATPVVNAPGTYTLTVTDPSNGCTNTSTVAIPQNITVPNANAGAPQTLTCTTTSITLNGSSTTAGATFSWSGPGIVSGGASATPVVNAPGTYTLTVTDPVNGCTNTSTVAIPQNIAVPNANAGAPQTLTCTTTSVTLSGSSTTAGATFSWAGPGIVSGGTSATPVVNAPGTYTLTVTDPVNGCTNTSTVAIPQNIVTPNANAGTPQTLTCTTTSITLNGSSTTAGATFSWAGPGIVSGGTSATPVVNAPGTYTVTVTDPVNGCTNTSTVAIPQNIVTPNANAGVPQTLTCTTTSITLNGSSTTAGATFSWAGPGIVSGGTSATPVVNAPGTYTLTVTDPVNGCTNTSTVAIPQNITVPNANAGAPQTLTCTTTSVTLSGSSTTAGATFSWAGPGIVSGGTSATPVVNAPGIYTVTVTDPVNGCTNTSTVAIPQNIVMPNADAGQPKILNCNITSVTLDGASSTSGATFSWSGPGIVSGGTTSSPTVNAPGSYTITVTDPVNGCSNTSSVNVSQNITLPNSNAGPDDILNCSNPAITLNGSSTTAGVSFSWNGPGIVSGANTATPSINVPGTYTLTTTDPTNGCSQSDDVVVNSDPIAPNVNAGNDLVINCTNPTGALNGSSSTAGVTFSWSGPGIQGASNTPSITVNMAGNYYLTVTNPGNGCVNSDFAVVTEDFVTPIVSAGSDFVLNCSSPSTTLNGTSNAVNSGFSWSGPGIVSGANTANPVINQAGIYTVTVTNNNNGCVSTDNVEIFNDQNSPNINFTADIRVGCTPLSVNFSDTNTNSNFIFNWSFGDGNSDNSGNMVSNVYQSEGCFDVTLTITDVSNGCTSVQTLTDYVCAYNVPNAEFSTNPDILDPADIYVDFNNLSTNGTDYVWSFGDGTFGTDVDPTHDYSQSEGEISIQLLVSNNGICFDSVIHSISVVEPMIFYVPNTFTPDSDQYNQTFQPVITSGIDIYNYTFLIYNRWGELIFESFDTEVGWDGSYKGKLVQEGVYTWTIKIKDKKVDEFKEYNGHVSLLR